MVNRDKVLLPANLQSLYEEEDRLRQESLRFIAQNTRLKQHLAITEAAMELADILRQFKTDDEDIKIIQVLGMRIFNAFGAIIKLSFSGYHQNAALILRDVLETIFLLDLFSSDRSQIERWRFADKKARLKEFRPIKVREILDARDNFTNKRRAELYDLLSELAGHPTMMSVLMMRPHNGSDAVIGPFMEPSRLEAVISETGRMAVQAGEHISHFIPHGWFAASHSLVAFAETKVAWMTTFYPTAVRRGRGDGA